MTRRIAAIGMFDGVHAGHKYLIRFLIDEGRRRGLVPAVVTFERHPLELVAPERAPYMLMDVRAKVDALRKAGVEDVVLLHFDGPLRSMTAEEFMTMLYRHYDVACLVVGYDHRFGRDRSESFDDYVRIGADIGIDVVRAPEKAGASSSIVRKLLKEGDVGAAAAILGAPYTITGVVVAGKQLGRTIGFPTANLSPVDRRQLIPAGGVYAAEVRIDGNNRHIRAMLNIGQRPTVDGGGAPLSIEVHVIGYEGNLYGHSMEVSFLRRLRDEMKFPSIDALRAQLEIDRREALK